MHPWTQLCPVSAPTIHQVAVAGELCMQPYRCTVSKACSHLDVVWILFLIIMLAAHQVGGAVAEVFEQLQCACKRFLCPTALLRVCPCNLMGKLIL